MKYKIDKTDINDKKYLSISTKSRLVKAFKNSSEKMSKFCHRHNIPTSTFSYWCKTYTESNTTPKLTEVILSKPDTKREIEIILENNLKVKLGVNNSVELMGLIKDLRKC